MGRRIQITESQLRYIIENVDRIDEQSGQDVYDAVRKVLESGAANVGGEWSKDFPTDLQNKLINAIVKKLKLDKNPKLLEKYTLTLDALENEMSGKQKVVSNKEGKVITNYGGAVKVWDKQQLSDKIADDYINASITGEKCSMMPIKKTRGGGNMKKQPHTQMVPSQISFPEGQYGVSFYHQFGETKLYGGTQGSDTEETPGGEQPSTAGLSVKLTNQFPFNLVRPVDPSGNLLPAFATEYEKIKKYVESSKNKIITINIFSSASQLSATNIRPSGYAGFKTHDYGQGVSFVDSKDDEGAKNVDNGNAYLAEHRGRRAMFELARYLGGSLTKSGGVYVINLPNLKKQIRFNFTHNVTGPDYSKEPGAKNASKEAYSKAQYIKMDVDVKEKAIAPSPGEEETTTKKTEPYYAAPASFLKVGMRLVNKVK